MLSYCHTATNTTTGLPRPSSVAIAIASRVCVITARLFVRNASQATTHSHGVHAEMIKWNQSIILFGRSVLLSFFPRSYLLKRSSSRCAYRMRLGWQRQQWCTIHVHAASIESRACDKGCPALWLSTWPPDTKPLLAPAILSIFSRTSKYMVQMGSNALVSLPGSK